MAEVAFRAGHTGGQNEYIWQSWATLEAKCGNASKARKVGHTKSAEGSR